MKQTSIRIVGGALKGRTIPTAPGRSVRPTSQRAREAIFNILGDRITRATFADFFSGTGAIGIEALSRGAVRAAFIDHRKEQQSALQKALSTLTLLPQSLVITSDIHLAIRNQNLLGWRPFDVLFLDPPYQFPSADQVLVSLESARLMSQEGLVIYEHFHKTRSPAVVGGWTRVREARYGDTTFSLYESSPGS